MRLKWLRLALLLPFVLIPLAFFVRVSALTWSRLQWMCVGGMLCAEVSAILAVLSIVRSNSVLRTVLDGANLAIALVGYHFAYEFSTFPDGPNPLWLAAISVGIAFAALGITSGFELTKRARGEAVVQAARGAIGWLRRLGPSTSLLVASLISLSPGLAVFELVDKGMWASLPSDPWRGGDLVSGEQATRMMIVAAALPICGSIYNLVVSIVLAIYRGRLWGGMIFAITLSACTILGSVPALGLMEGARAYLGDSPWQMGRAFIGLGAYSAPVILLFLVITHFRISMSQS